MVVLAIPTEVVYPEVMAKNKPYFVTPDYSVQITGANSISCAEYTTEQLTASHEQFVAFRQGLRDRFLLPENENESNEAAFVQDKIGSRTMSFRIKPFAEFVADSEGTPLDEYNHSNRPDMHFFQAHLQKPAVYLLPLARLSRMYPSDFPQQKTSNFELIIDGEVESVSMGSEGVDYRKALAVLDLLVSGVSSMLTREGIAPNPERVIRFWALSRFVELGYSVQSRNSNVKNPTLEAFVLDLIRVDAPLYTAFLAISQAANPDYSVTKKFTYSAKSVAELGEIPKTFLRYMMLSE